MGARGGNSNLHAKETRLSLDIRGPVEGKELRMYVETDFYGSSNALRLRQAYGSCGGLLAGQPGRPSWTRRLSQHHRLRIADGLPVDPAGAAAVDGETEREAVVVGGSRGQQVDDRAAPGDPGRPGIRCRTWSTGVRFEGSRGHAFVSGFLGRARFRPAEGEPDDVTLWGVLLSGRIKTFGRDYAYGQFTFGEGVGRYRGGGDRGARCERPAARAGLSAFMAATSTSGRPSLVERGLQPGVVGRRRTSYSARCQQ